MSETTTFNILIGVLAFAEKFVLVYCALLAMFAFNIPETMSSNVTIRDGGFLIAALGMLLFSCFLGIAKRGLARIN